MLNEKFYITLGTAKLLKDYGYNEDTDYVIFGDSNIVRNDYSLTNKYLPQEYGENYSCPTIFEVVDYLEQVYGFIVETNVLEPNKYTFIIGQYNNNKVNFIHTDYTFNNRFIALESGVVYVLKNLLKK